jgi:hypothetical protein
MATDNYKAERRKTDIRREKVFKAKISPRQIIYEQRVLPRMSESFGVWLLRGIKRC